jgi:sugar phosphate isomerase/epimerase
MKTAIITDEVSQEFEDVLRFASDFQLDGLEIRSLWNKPPHKLSDEEVKLIRTRCAGKGLAICGIASPVFKCDIEKEEELEAHVEIFKRCLHLAEEWNAPVIRVFTGWRRENNKELFPRIARAFREKLLPLVKGKPVLLGIENEYSTNVADGEEAAGFLRELKSDQVTLVWDPCNILYMPNSSDPFEVDYPKVRGKIGHYHVKDADRVPGAEPPAESTALGDGQARLRDTLEALREDGYRGWVSLETHWRMQKKLGEDVTRSPMGADFSANAEPASRECMKRLKSWLGEER